MARTPSPDAEPGRIRQMWQVFQMTRRYDPTVVWLLVLAFVVPVALAVILALVFAAGNIVFWILWVVAGVLGGALLVLTVLGRRAEKAVYSQIAGQPGAVGAVLRGGLRRSWTGSEMPVNVSPRTQDAVYRAVGRGGVVLIGEGPRSRTQPMIDKERANVARVLPNVPVNVLYVGPDADAITLDRIVPSLARFKKALTKSEIQQVASRLSSLDRKNSPVSAIPKGIDPTRVRAPRPR